jgi:hypothetical protein
MRTFFRLMQVRKPKSAATLRLKVVQNPRQAHQRRARLSHKCTQVIDLEGINDWHSECIETEA